MTCEKCGHRHCDKSGGLGCAFCRCGHPASCECGGCALTKFLDRDEEVDIGDDLKAVMTPAELAEVDQLLASRYDLAEALMGSGKTEMVMQRAAWTVNRITALLRAAIERRDAG